MPTLVLLLASPHPVFPLNSEPYFTGKILMVPEE